MQKKLNTGAQLHTFLAFPLSQASSFESLTNKKHHIFFVYTWHAAHDAQQW